jgi:hypothetical protein
MQLYLFWWLLPSGHAMGNNIDRLAHIKKSKRAPGSEDATC